MKRASFCAVFFILLLAGGPMRPAAGQAPPLASQQSPPRFIDETDLELSLLDRVGGYEFFLKTVIYGPLSPSDAVRVDFTQRGKVLGSQRCPLNGGDDATSLKCRYDGKPINAVGPVTVNLILLDDQAEKEYLLRQFNVTVAVFPWMQERHYQILHDDMLGAAFAWHAVTRNDTNHKIQFLFWTTGSFKEDPQLRCAVNGRKEPDFRSWRSTSVGDVSVDALINEEKRTYSWGPEIVTTDRLLWGSREEIMKDRNWNEEEFERLTTGGEYRFLAAMPGAWSCDLRYQGSVIRQFSFHVNDRGRIQPSAAQGAPGFPRLPPGVVHIDMRLPAKNNFDTRVRPDAIARSMPYGMPWPKHPMFDAFLQSLPPASGLTDPPVTGKSAPAGQRKGPR
jgi:hypothetical protein